MHFPVSRALLPLITLLLVVLVTWPQVIRAEDSKVWQFFESGDSDGSAGKAARLIYGVPETDDVQVEGTCTKAAASEPKSVILRFGADTGDLKDGQDAKLRFSGGGFSYAVDGEVFGKNAEVGPSGVKVEIATDDELWDGLTDKASLDYQVPGYRFASLEMAKGRKAIRTFKRACRKFAEADPEEDKTAETETDTGGGGLSQKEAYEAAKEVGTLDAWEAFLLRYPEGFLSDLARAYVKQLGDGTSDEGKSAAETAEPTEDAQPVEPADISLSMTSQDVCRGGRSCTVTVTATNSGGETYDGPIVIATSLAPGGAELRGSGTPPYSCEGLGGGAICSHYGAGLAPGQSAIIPMTFTLPRSAGGEVTACASIAWGGVPAALGAADVQRKLNELGFDAGPVDGQPGRKTEDAIRSFQQSEGLQETGEVDLPLILALFAPGGEGDANPVNDQACAGAAVTPAPPISAAFDDVGPSCPPGQIIRRNGECGCPRSVPVWTGASCVPRLRRNCTGGRYYDKRQKLCLCPSRRPHWYNGRCHAKFDDCPGDSVRVGDKCLKENDPGFQARPGRGPGLGRGCGRNSIRIGNVCVNVQAAPVFGGGNKKPGFGGGNKKPGVFGQGGANKPAGSQGGGNKPNLSLLQGDCNLSGRCAYVQLKGSCKRPLVRNGNFCVCPSTNQIWNGNTCVTAKKGQCPKGQAIYPKMGCVSTKLIQIWDQEKKICSSNPTCAFFLHPSSTTCKPPLYFDDNSCWCPKGTTYNGKTCVGSGGGPKAPPPVVKQVRGVCPVGVQTGLNCACPAGTISQKIAPGGSGRATGQICTRTGGQQPAAQKPKGPCPVGVQTGLNCTCPAGTVSQKIAPGGSGRATGQICTRTGGQQPAAQKPKGPCPVGVQTGLNCTCPAGTISQKIAPGGSGRATGQICTRSGGQQPAAQKPQKQGPKVCGPNEKAANCNCPPGMVKDAVSPGSLPCRPACPAGQSRLYGVCCPNGWGRSGNGCAPPAGQAKPQPQKPQQQRVVCSNGAFKAGAGCACRSGFDIFVARRTNQAVTYGCRQKAAPGVKCGPGMRAQGNKCVSIQKPGGATSKEIFCAPGTGLVPQNGKCGCPPGRQWNGKVCAAPQQRKAQPTHVVNCAGGQRAGNGCRCPAGQAPQLVTSARKPDGSTVRNFKCVSTGVKCGPGMRPQGNKCVSVQKPGSNTKKEIFCAPGTGLVPANGRCVCPPGRQWNGKVCAAPQQQRQQQPKQQFQQRQQPQQQPQNNNGCPPGTQRIGNGCVNVKQIQKNLNNIFSDQRLKRDVQLVATRDDGLKFYSFRYLWDEEQYVGVMAQDLLADPSRADAVSLHESGYFQVDYGRLGIEMMTLDKWKTQEAALSARAMPYTRTK